MTHKASSEIENAPLGQSEDDQQKATPGQLEWQSKLREWIEPELKRRGSSAGPPDWNTAEIELAKELKTATKGSSKSRHIRSGMATRVIGMVNSFLRLDSKRVDAFRKAHPNFFPPAFWDCVLDFTKATPSTTWPDLESGPLLAMDISEPADIQKYGLNARDEAGMRVSFQSLKHCPVWRVWRHLLRQSWSDGVDIGELLWVPWVCLPESDRRNPFPRFRFGERTWRFAPEWEFQDAVIGLALQSWRARFCLNCGEPYVAENRRSTYCGVKCSGEASHRFDLDRKLKHYRKHAKEINARRRKKYREAIKRKQQHRPGGARLAS